MNSSGTNNSQSEENLTQVIKYINIFYPIVLSVTSTIGNSLSFVVFSSQVFQFNGSGFFLKLKAIVDIFNVYIGTLRYTYQGFTDTDIKNTSKFWCYFLGVGVYIVDAFSSWLSVFVSLDRVILVYKPSLYKIISRKRIFYFQLAVIVVSFSIIVAINLLKLLSLEYAKIKDGKKIAYSCTTINSPFVESVQFVITFIIPFILMSISSSIFIHQLIKLSSHVNKYRHNPNQRLIVSNRKNIVIIRTVLCLDICFLVFNLPRFALQYIKETTPFYFLMMQMSTLMKYSYYSFSFIVYVFTNNLFRDRLKTFIFDELQLFNF